MPRYLVRAGREAAAFCFFLGLAVVATWPLATDLSGQTLAGPDPLIDLWTLHWLTGHAFDPAQFYGGNIYCPSPHAVLYSDLSMGTAVLVLPLRLFVNDPVLLYNLGLLLALAFAGWAFQALAVELTGQVWAGILAGVLAAFGSHQMFHVYHLNLLSTGWLAFLLLALHRIAQRPTWAASTLAGVSFALAAQSSGYYAVAAAAIALVFAACHARSLARREAFLRLGAAALLGALLTLPYLLAFLEVREREALHRPPGMSVRMAFQPGRDLSSDGYLYRSVLGSGGERLFPGLLALGLATVALTRRRPHAVFYAVATLALLVLSLGPQLDVAGAEISLPYRWLSALPPLDAMRHPYSFAAVATFLLSVLAAIGWSSLRFAERPWAGPLVVGLAVLETLAPPPDLRPAPSGLPPVYERLMTLPPGPILELPVFETDALLWAARHGRPVLNGAGAFAPTNTRRLENFIDNQWIKKTPADVDASRPTDFLLEEFPVRYVVLRVGERPSFRGLAQAFDRSRSFSLAAEIPDGDRIYEARRESESSADPGEGGK